MRRIFAAAGIFGTLGWCATPAWAAPGQSADSQHFFSIPGVHGINAWGNYQRSGRQVRVTVCVTDTAGDVYGGAAAAVAFGGHDHQSVAATTIGYRHAACRTMVSGDTSHLTAVAVSGYRNGTVRQRGRVITVY